MTSQEYWKTVDHQFDYHNNKMVQLDLRVATVNAFSAGYREAKSEQTPSISSADWPWQRPTQDGQACWVWYMLAYELKYKWHLHSNGSSIFGPDPTVVANHPQGLPPPDGFRLEEASNAKTN